MKRRGGAGLRSPSSNARRRRRSTSWSRSRTGATRPCTKTSPRSSTASCAANRSRLESQIKSLGLRATVVGDQHTAEVVLTVRNYYRRKPQALRDAEATGVPVHVLRSNSAGNIEQELLHISHLDAAPVPGAAQNALRETKEAIAHVLETSAPVELSPESAYIRRLQHQLAEQHNLSSRSTGPAPYRRVRISKAD